MKKKRTIMNNADVVIVKQAFIVATTAREGKKKGGKSQVEKCVQEESKDQIKV